jgi:hypothetical protein
MMLANTRSRPHDGNNQGHEGIDPHPVKDQAIILYPHEFDVGREPTILSTSEMGVKETPGSTTVSDARPSSSFLDSNRSK